MDENRFCFEIALLGLNWFTRGNKNSSGSKGGLNKNTPKEGRDYNINVQRRNTGERGEVEKGGGQVWYIAFRGLFEYEGRGLVF